MPHFSRITLTNPINGRVAQACVMGDPDRVRGEDRYPADVYISLDCGVSLQLRMTPQEARQLAQQLTAAADVAAPLPLAEASRAGMWNVIPKAEREELARAFSRSFRERAGGVPA